MDPTASYYITTLTTAFKNIAPVLAFIIGGYFVFVKLPFLFLKKSMDDQKKKLHEENKDLLPSEKKYSVEDYKEFQRKLKLMNGSLDSSFSKDKVLELPGQKRVGTKQEQKREQQKERDQQEKKTEQKKQDPPKKPDPSASQSPEEVLGFKANESFTKSELKKRYFELLKQNHPDRVASMGQDFKRLAEKNTKEINRAYDKLKDKAS